MLDLLSKNEILNGKIPICELLENSMYYPSIGFDGGVVKNFSKEIQSFIYCDYGLSEEQLISQMDTFRGYKIFANRKLEQSELTPNGFSMQLPPNFNLDRYNRFHEKFAKPFAHWTVYERLAEFDDSHGPEKFSLIFIGGEGVATYQALYWSNQKFAKALPIIQPRIGFGLNWTDFRRRDKELAWVFMSNKFGTPETVIYGGISSGYKDFSWEEYEYQSTIDSYYGSPSSGEITIWKKVSD